jgi:hypothetical protein
MQAYYKHQSLEHTGIKVTTRNHLRMARGPNQVRRLAS